MTPEQLRRSRVERSWWTLTTLITFALGGLIAIIVHDERFFLLPLVVIVARFINLLAMRDE